MKRTAADIRWSKAVRERDDYICQRCGKQYDRSSFGIHAAHIFSRGIMRTRHDIDNGITLDYGCHRVFDAMSKEDRESFARSILGDEKYEALRVRARNPRKRQPCQGVEDREAGCVR